MVVTSREFFSNLRVDIKYFTKVFKQIGVKSSYNFDKEDLEIIAKLSNGRYKTFLVSERAKSLLEVLQCQN